MEAARCYIKMFRLIETYWAIPNRLIRTLGEQGVYQTTSPLQKSFMLNK